MTGSSIKGRNLFISDIIIKISGSYLSLREGAEGRSSRKKTMVLGTHGLRNSLMADDYFSNMNPRAMKRIVNALTLTGRLVKVALEKLCNRSACVSMDFFCAL